MQHFTAFNWAGLHFSANNKAESMANFCAIYACSDTHLGTEHDFNCIGFLYHKYLPPFLPPFFESKAENFTSYHGVTVMTFAQHEYLRYPATSNPSFVKEISRFEYSNELIWYQSPAVTTFLQNWEGVIVSDVFMLEIFSLLHLRPVDDKFLKHYGPDSNTVIFSGLD